ncbi:cytochrome [Salipiger aestuarii]|uniref:Cytochrome P450 n=1 Tax=Salipiger aestuarii TaxID=568098 RepID=A0A327Y6S3_9RHOB|nr:cytochrome P450 [Salipiger aestuarii]KAA8608120.1 cytochrome [Salipiger aestuarii]KAB2542058.1 cytochrome [Salipiger aestuarii]RAK16504.1 cytochrome P450 [Salipiger aestuarii]
MSLETQFPDAPFLDVANPAFSLRSEPVRAARGKSWYARTPYGLAVLRHKEMGQLLTHKSLIQGSHAWPALNGVTTGVFADWWNKSILVTEGDDHWRLRKLVNPAFSPGTVKALMPHFERIANDLADGFIDRGCCDFMAEFADPYAARVLCLLLGLPEKEAPFILRTSATMGLALGVNFPDLVDTIEAATVELGDYISDVLKARETAPGDDILSVLVQAREDGDRLSQEELWNVALMLAFAGVDTTRNQLGLGMSMFAAHPDQWEALAADPSLDMAAATEVMRMRPTITWVSREAIEDFEYGGITIPKGTVLHLYSESAGTDPEVMADAPFDITARRARNFGFGGGVHHCLGNLVARNDMAVAYRVLSARMSAPVVDARATWLADSGNTGPIALPITFSAR